MRLSFLHHSPTWALFVRSVRLETRAITSYVARALLLLPILLALFVIYQSRGRVGASGSNFFLVVMTIDLVLISLAATSHFASVITEEKEERTLGLLRMTRLNAVSILLGKSSSRIVSALLLLVVQAPFTLLAVALGGVTTIQILAAYAVLGAYVLLVANLGLLTSVICYRSRVSSALTFLFLLAFHAGPGLVWELRRLALRSRHLLDGGVVDGGIQWACELLWSLNPFVAITEMYGGGVPSTLGLQLTVSSVVGLGLFLLAWWLFENLDQREEPLARPGWTRERSSRRAWRAAIAGKEFRHTVGGRPGLLFRCLGYLLLAVVIILLGDSPVPSEDLGDRFRRFAMIFGILEVALFSARILGSEVHTGTWPTLSLVTTKSAIVGSKLIGCFLGLTPALVLFAVGAGMNPRGVVDDLDSMGRTGAWLPFVSSLVLLPTLITYLSLYLKRGAVVAGFAIFIVGSNLLPIFMLAQGDPDAVMFTVSLIMLVVAGALLADMPRRLRVLGAR